LAQRVDAANRAIELDAADDRISLGWARAGFWVPLAGLAVLGVLFVVHRPWYYSLQREDHPVEWAQFSLTLFCSIVFALAAVRFARKGHRGLAFLLLLVALGSLGLAGEEISWGQRVLGLATPDELAGVNHQSEMNVHNINVGIPSEHLFKLFAFTMGAVGAALSLLARRPGGYLDRTSWRLVAPPLLTIPGFLAMPLYWIFMVVSPGINPVIRAQEWIEVALYTSLSITAICCYTRLAHQGDPRMTDDDNDNDTTGRLPLLAFVATGVLILTLVFALLTAHSGVLPGNI
jgi:hypothetical protein